MRLRKGLQMFMFPTGVPDSTCRLIQSSPGPNGPHSTPGPDARRACSESPSIPERNWHLVSAHHPNES
ncbi:hypothetical protein N656DRAFT_777609 [Canariomyces notabilis]|uniref:Uncharacterized protein n=1 Tax=Canariomyces notabilis TaxID=2074819 RepID=A0AAN6THA2_9PEZI|nr:hypothetical protein N656DRAFT_777609 [Canariomyces arenarius]